MPENLETLCTFDVKIAPEGHDLVMDSVYLTMDKLGFIRNGRKWYDGKFTAKIDSFPERKYYRLVVHFQSPFPTTTPVIELLRQAIVRNEEHITSMTTSYGDGYRNCIRMKKESPILEVPKI